VEGATMRVAKIFGICQQKQLKFDCISFCRAEKNLGIVAKSRVFCLAAQRNFLELRRKALHFVSEKQPSEILPTKALYLVMPRSESFFWNLSTKNNSTGLHFVLQCSTNFGISNKHCILSAVQRKLLDLRPKAMYFVQRTAKSFGTANKSTVFCLVSQRKFWNCEQTPYLVQRAEEIWNCDQKLNRAAKMLQL
jgi:hypothetical protein